MTRVLPKHWDWYGREWCLNQRSERRLNIDVCTKREVYNHEGVNLNYGVKTNKRRGLTIKLCPKIEVYNQWRCQPELWCQNPKKRCITIKVSTQKGKTKVYNHEGVNLKDKGGMVFKPRVVRKGSQKVCCRLDSELTWISLKSMNRGEYSKQLDHLSCTQNIQNEDKNDLFHSFSIA